MSSFDALFKTSDEEENGRKFIIDQNFNEVPKKTKDTFTLIIRSPESDHYRREQLKLSSKLAPSSSRNGFRKKKAKDSEVTPEETMTFVKELVANSLWVGSVDLKSDGKEVGETVDSRLEALTVAPRLQDLISYLSESFLEVDDNSDQT